MLSISTLNEAQQETVVAKERSILVIAGAGSGKTRTLIYRLAWLIEHGVPIHHILLLTFTRKAAAQMLERASLLLDQNIQSMNSGTFHSFAFSVLRRYPEFCMRFTSKKEGNISIIDSSEQNACITQCKEILKIPKGDKAFPKVQTISSLLSKARNKEISLEEVIQKEGKHLLPYAETLTQIAQEYTRYKQGFGLYDYDDLLFELEALFLSHPEVLLHYQSFLKHIMVDEYQDTNKVQARLVKILAGKSGNVLAVGDDAQSIYAFRGASVKNILEFPKHFSRTHIIYLEENYRSVQPILNVANTVLAYAKEGYQKNLFSNILLSEASPFPVRIYRTLSDISQAKVAVNRIYELLTSSKPSEIALLFRSGYQSYHLEVELTKNSLHYKKYGGIKYTEAAHVKDFLSYARLILNSQDYIAFERVAGFTKGIGTKTAKKIYNSLLSGDRAEIEKIFKKYPLFEKDIELIERLKKHYFAVEEEKKINLHDLLESLFERYKEIIPSIYPDDYPRRLIGVEEIISIGQDYNDLDLFVAELALNMTEENEQEEDNKIIISTIHSAKGLEWDHVFVMDLTEGRFPSHHALTREEDFEEERRLFYVAVTRARKNLDLFVPLATYNRTKGEFENSAPSPFVRTLKNEQYKEYYEGMGGIVYQKTTAEMRIGREEDFLTQESSIHTIKENNEREDIFSYLSEYAKDNKSQYKDYGYCQHKVFGRGKIIAEVDDEKYKINFINIGVKIIYKSYVELEEK